MATVDVKGLTIHQHTYDVRLLNSRSY